MWLVVLWKTEGKDGRKETSEKAVVVSLGLLEMGTRWGVDIPFGNRD